MGLVSYQTFMTTIDALKQHGRIRVSAHVAYTTRKVGA
jgi:hypothetical protein